MRRIIILLLSFYIFSISVSAQDSYIKDRWNIKLGYSVYTSKLFYFGSGFSGTPVDNNNYRLELNYGIFNKIETGAYAGYSKIEVLEPGSFPGSFEGYHTKALFYGTNCNYHLLPLIIKEDDFRFDLYATGKLGVMSIYKPKGSPYIGSHFEYSVGGGAAFYLLKRVGAFIEYTYGKYYYDDNKKLRYGLSIKF